MANLSLRSRCGICITLAALLLVGTARAQDRSAADRATDTGVDCLAANIYHEARGESILGQLAVAWVTLNRVNDRRWPNTICGVVYQKWQFSWTNDGLSDAMTNLPSRWLAQLIAKQHKTFPILIGADHYHANYVNPYWAKSMTREITINNHIFYTSTNQPAECEAGSSN